MTTLSNTVSVKSLNYQRQDAPGWHLEVSSLDVRQEEKLFIYGSSGSGKTTLLDLLTGINTASNGSINILGSDLVSMKTRQRDQFRADHIGLIFQQFNLLPYLDVVNNVILPCHFSKNRKQKALAAGSLREVAIKILDSLGFNDDLYDRQATRLSVGEQQRVAVARSLMGQPDLIIADEPTSALDEDTRDEFIDLLLKSVGETNSTVIFVSHDKSLARHFDRQLDIRSLAANNKVE